MAKTYVIEPYGWPCTLAECPCGPFFWDGNRLCFKSEYASDGKCDAYNAAGEYFWGGTSNAKARAALMVQPVRIIEKDTEL
jgi:hypothetical protein